MTSLPEAIKECLTCSICFKLYTEPKTLPCLHTFCKSCLKSFIEKCTSDGSCACPICRTNFLRSGEHVKTNFDIQKMIDAGEFSTSSQHIFCSFCTLKDRNELAVSQCVTCLDFLCKTCSESRHTFTRQTFNHKIVSLSDIKKGKYDKEIRLLQMMRCSKHRNEILRMHCIPCNSYVCSECIVLEHNQHKLQTIPSAREDSECKLQKSLETLKKTHGKISNSKSKLSMHIKEISEKKKLLQIQIEETCTEAIKNIREIQMEVKKELEEVFDPSLEVVQTSFEDCSDLCIRIEKVINKSEIDLVSAHDFEAIQMCDEMKHKAKELERECDTKDFSCPIVKIPNLHITWNEPNMRILSEDEPDILNASIKKKTDADETGEDSRVFSPQTQDNSSKLTCVPTFAVYDVNLIETLTLKESSDNQKPIFSSVTWIDKDNIAVIDQANDKIKVFHLTNRICMSRIMPFVLTVSACEMGIACKTGNDCMKVFKSPLMEIKKESNVACVISSVLNNSNLKWITKQDVFSYSKDTLSKMSIKSRENFSLPKRPKNAFCCVNGTLIVSDKRNDCVYFINTDGEIMKQIDHYPGSIAQNDKEHIFITDSEQGTISVFDYTGKWHSEIKFGTWQKLPKCISIMDDKLLVATHHKILLCELKLK